jgi:hypothetical protein
VAVIAAGLLLGGGGAAAAGIMREIPGPGSGPAGHGHPPAGHTQRPADGRITGKFQRVGGPLGPGGKQPPVVALSGTMRFTRAGHQTITVRVGKSGRFAVRLAPGTYRVSGRTPDIRGEPGDAEATCSLPGAVTVRAGAVRHVTVVCAVP